MSALENPSSQSIFFLFFFFCPPSLQQLLLGRKEAAAQIAQLPSEDAEQKEHSERAEKLAAVQKELADKSLLAALAAPRGISSRCTGPPQGLRARCSALGALGGPAAAASQLLRLL